MAVVLRFKGGAAERFDVDPQIRAWRLRRALPEQARQGRNRRLGPEQPRGERVPKAVHPVEVDLGLLDAGPATVPAEHTVQVALGRQRLVWRGMPDEQG